MSASQSDSSFGNMIELAEIISDRSAVSEPVAEMNVGTSTKKRISKTSMLFAILGSLAIMILCEIVTGIYKNI